MTQEQKKLITIPRKIVPNMIAQGLVGVQPMSSPTEQRHTWQSYLKQLQLEYGSLTMFDAKRRDEGLACATGLMHKRYPGPYRIVEKYDPDRGIFSFKLKFDDPQEEIIWLLRWS